MRSRLIDVIRVSRQIDNATKCKVCKLSTIVLSEAGAGAARGSRTRPATVAPETHCACPARDGRPQGPAFVAPGKTDADVLINMGLIP